jgi:aminomethyltransferase
VEVADESDEWALIALQGPEAASLLQGITSTDLSALKYYRFVEGELETTGTAGVSPALTSRTGYTGEDGFELYLRPESAPGLWRRLVEAGAVPAGLGARDTLRLEAGMCLYGNELDPETTPLEAGIGFAVHLDKEAEFVGQQALREEEREGLRKKLVGFEVEGRGIARHDYPVIVDGERVGKVTSGTQSPTLNKAIGLALVRPDVEDTFEVEVRGRSVAARAVPLPFYKREKR